VIRINSYKLFNGLETAFAVLALLLFTGVLVAFTHSKASQIESGTAAGNRMAQLLFMAIHLVTFCLIALRWKRVLRSLLLIDKSLLILTGFIMASLLWSEAPSVSLRRGVGLTLTTIFGIYLATRFGLKQQVQLLGWALGLLLIITFAYTVVWPEYGISSGSHEGAWRGTFSNKNLLGRLTVLSAVIFLLLTLSSRRQRWLGWTAFGLAVLLLLLTTSKTSLVVFITLIALIPALQMMRWHFSLMLAFGIIAALVAAIIIIWSVANFETLVEGLGKDATLTGRTPLWEGVMVMIKERFWLGYGYSAFWLGWSGPSAYVWDELHWRPPHAHNGYLDIWLEVGLVGLALYLISIIMAAQRAVTWVRLTKTADGFWPLLLIVFVLLYNFTESVSVARGSNNIYWVLYVAIATSLSLAPHRLLQQHRSQKLSATKSRAHANGPKTQHSYL